MRNPFRRLAFLLLLLLLAGCAVNPVTGQQELMLVSEQDEAQLGLKTDRSVTEQYGLYDDPRLQEYVHGLGTAMARLSHRPGLPWQFKVMDSEIVNAFAAPGGYIYVTRGLLAAVNNEAELAGVLGHEIAHVTARHSAQQYSKMMMANLGMQLGTALAGSYGDLLSPVAQTGASLLFLKFSRDDEREADALGVEYATRSGFDAARTADFFATLKSQSSLPESGGQRLPEFFSSHPDPGNREVTVRQMALDIQARTPGVSYRADRAAFLRQIDGLVFGRDPYHGFRDGDWYVLPRYRVRLPIPRGWSVDQDGQSLQMVHPEKKAVVLASVRSGSDIDREIADFVKGTGAQVRQDRRLSTDGLPSRLILSILSDGSKRAIVVSRFIQKGGDVFAVHGLTPEAGYRDLGATIQQPGQGFATTSDPAHTDPKRQRIVIQTVARSDTLEKLFEHYRIDRELWDKVAWLNGRQRGDRVNAGELIKIVR